MTFSFHITVIIILVILRPALINVVHNVSTCMRYTKGTSGWSDSRPKCGYFVHERQVVLLIELIRFSSSFSLSHPLNEIALLPLSTFIKSTNLVNISMVICVVHQEESRMMTLTFKRMENSWDYNSENWLCCTIKWWRSFSDGKCF